MAVLARAFDVPFIVDGEKAEEILNKKPTPEQIAYSKRLAEKAEKIFIVKSNRCDQSGG